MDRLLTYNEVAEIMNLSRRTIELWVSTGKITHIKLGDKNSSVRFTQSEIDKLIESKKVKSWLH